jgi:Holliday junction resolvase RusA-like endonuclease
MKIIFKGVPPSKKNSKQIFMAGNRPVIMPSKLYKAWHEEMMWKMKGIKPIKGKVKLSMTLYAKDRRNGDLSNRFESIADLLVDAGVIEDDNWNIVHKVEMIFGGIDKDNPRAEVTITR